MASGIVRVLESNLQGSRETRRAHELILGKLLILEAECRRGDDPESAIVLGVISEEIDRQRRLVMEFAADVRQIEEQLEGEL